MDNDARHPALCIFEDDRYPNFFPLALDRPVFDLAIGTHSLAGRIVDEISPESVVLLCRPYLEPVLASEGTLQASCAVRVNEPLVGETLFVNGRLLAYGTELSELLGSLAPESMLHKKGTIVAALLSPERAVSFADRMRGILSDEGVEKVVNEIKRASAAREEEDERAETDASRGKELAAWARKNGIKLKETGVRLVSHYWQLIAENGACIVDDFQKNPLRGTAPETELFKGVELINEADIVLGSGVEVRSGTVFDASDGAIVVANNVRIEPNAIIYGPCFVGEGSIIRGGAKIGRGTSLGTQCRVGGEVEECIFASFSNKQHGGFMGHSYVGSWVNVGAGSCTSDLKNNYGLVKSWNAGRMRETGRRFLGATIGDHAKIAINSRLNTGTVVGFNANVVSVGFPPKFVPSFTWRLEPEFERCTLESAEETAKIMMDRRNVAFTDAHADLFKTIHRLCRQSSNTI